MLKEQKEDHMVGKEREGEVEGDVAGEVGRGPCGLSWL